MFAFKSFFRSWYGSWAVFIYLAAASSVLIAFCTTPASLSASITMQKHLVIFVFSFVLMLLAVLLIGYVVYLLDRDIYLQQHELQRYGIQFVVLVVLLGAIARLTVDMLYALCFGIDQQREEYFERYFVGVMFCLTMVQVYYAFRKERKLRIFARMRVLVMRVAMQHHQARLDDLITDRDKHIARLHTQLEEQRSLYEQELRELKGRKQRLRNNYERLNRNENRLKECFKEVNEQIEVMLGAEREWVTVSQISFFYLKEGSSRSKLVDVVLLDGREGSVDMDSLSKIEKRWPNLFFRASRSVLIQYFAIRSYAKVGDTYSVHLYGNKQNHHVLTAQSYERLVEIRQEWERAIH